MKVFTPGGRVCFVLNYSFLKTMIMKIKIMTLKSLSQKISKIFAQLYLKLVALTWKEF